MNANRLNFKPNTSIPDIKRSCNEISHVEPHVLVYLVIRCNILTKVTRRLPQHTDPNERKTAGWKDFKTTASRLFWSCFGCCSLELDGDEGGDELDIDNEWCTIDFSWNYQLLTALRQLHAPCTRWEKQKANTAIVVRIIRSNNPTYESVTHMTV